MEKQADRCAAQRILTDVTRLHSEGRFHVRLDQIFPLEQTAEAQDASAKGRVTGKLIVSIAWSQDAQ